MSLLERYQGIRGPQNIREALFLHTSLQNDPEVIKAFSEGGEIGIYLPGEVLIRQGESDRDILYILTGEVSIEVNGDTSRRRYSGDHIGEMALVDASSTRSATVRAMVETAVLKINVHTFAYLADGNKGFLWKNIAIELAFRLRQRLADIRPTRRLVLLIHGIRTRAEWQQMVKERLGNEYTKVIPIKYGVLDLIRFWFPFFTRNFAIRRTEEKICRAIDDHQDHEVAVIAHSFGTYAISKILKRNPFIKVRRLILCGCIISEKFKWGDLTNRPALILNDCGHRDLYPILATSSTFGYGATGVFGYGGSEVEDRFFDIGHSGFFTVNFVDAYWKPFIERGHIENSSYTLKNISWWRSYLALKSFVILLMTLVCVVIILVIMLLF